MKKIIVIPLLLCVVHSVFSQTDSLLWDNYEKKVLENSQLKESLDTLKEDLGDLNRAYSKDTFALQQQIKNLKGELKSEKAKVSNLKKKKVIAERDNLLLKVDSSNNAIAKLNKTISDKDEEIAITEARGEEKAREEKEKGKAEAMAKIVHLYKNKPFDDLVESSSKEVVARDKELVGDKLDVKPILNDLQAYFEVRELLSNKFDISEINAAKTKLNQIGRESSLHDALKEDVEYYQYYNTALKETINNLVDLDNRKSTGGDSGIQKLKFNEIVTELAGYMYNYYNYGNYPYLSDIVLEVIKRKKYNADADITDLLKLL